MSIHPLRVWRSQQKDAAGKPISGLQLARELGVSSSMITEWESGTRNPGPEFAIAIERRTAGAVPIETWGYQDLFESIAAVVAARNACAEAQTAVALWRTSSFSLASRSASQSFCAGRRAPECPLRTSIRSPAR